MARTVAALSLAALAPQAAAFVPQTLGQLRASNQASDSNNNNKASAGFAAPAVPQAAEQQSSSTAIGFTAVGLAAAAAVAAAAHHPRRAGRVERYVECQPGVGLGGGVGTSLNYGAGELAPVVGVCWPLMEKFDPLNMGWTDAKMERYTAVELKNGRVAMIAVLGYIMPEMFRFPGCEGYESGLGALTSLPLEGWLQIVALIGAHEVLIKPRQGGMGMYDFGSGTELLEGIEPAELHRRQTAERNNGRLAMIAIMGLMVQDGLFPGNPIANLKTTGWWGNPAVDMWVNDIPICHIAGCALPRERRAGLTAMRAQAGGGSGPPEVEMSVAVPFLVYPKVLRGWVGGEKGFDPLGVTDALPVYLVREAELKHGRICMLATVGWIATDLGMRFPGEKFAAIANSVNAHDQCVAAGYMTPFLGAIGTLELFSLWLIFEGWEGKAQRDAGDYFLGKKWMPKEPEKEKDLRMKEIENGRLAMFAFSGIVTQAVITGKSWPFM